MQRDRERQRERKSEILRASHLMAYSKMPMIVKAELMLKPGHRNLTQVPCEGGRNAVT